MKRGFTIALVFLAGSVLTSALTAQSPKKTLGKATKALGKKSDIKRVTSWRKSGLIIRDADGVSGEYVAQNAKPGLYNRQFDIAGFEHEVGFNGRSGWVRDSRSGLRTLTGAASEDFRAEVDYRTWRWIDYKKLKSKVFGEGAVVLNGKPVNAVTLVSAKGVPTKMYFDAASNLLVREEIRAGETMQVYEYGDYRPVNGVLEPFEMKMNFDGDNYTVRFDRITHNVMIEQSEFEFPRLSNRPLPDIEQLLRDLQANQDEIELILEDYSYKQQTIKRDISDEGKVVVTETETVQLSFYEGFRIQRVIARNGQPLSPKDQAEADKDAQKRVREIEKKLAKEDRELAQTSSGTPSDRGGRISIGEVLRASVLTNPRRERLKGRDVVVFDFAPDPNFDFKNAKSFLKFFGKTVGVMWIDENDKQVARIEAVLADSYKVGGGLLAKLRKGASFTLEQERVNDEIWLPTVADINLSIRVLLFGGVKVNQVVRSFDYEKFRTEVKEATVDEVVDQ